MRCPNCQTINPEGARFCLDCGTALVNARPAEGERKLVTVMFADVVGSTAIAESLDPEQVTDLMNGAFAFLNAGVAKYGGTVARLMGDAILAFFGAPAAHEDDAERAVRAALAIQASAEEYARTINREYGVDFKVRVGINTGLAVLDVVGDRIKTEYTAMGDTTNVGARLQSAAEPGAVLISADTYQLVRHAFEVEPRGALAVKGKSAPIQVYRVLGAKVQPGNARGLEGLESPLVGRNAELELLRQGLKELLAGQGAFVAIVGEAGIGKSRLVAELREQTTDGRQQSADGSPQSAVASWQSTVGGQWSEVSDLPHLPPTQMPGSAIGDQLSAIRWLEGRAISYGQSISYYPWRQIIRQSIGAQEGDTPATVRGKLNFVCECCSLPGGDIPFLEALLAVESEESLTALRGYEGQALIRRISEATQGYVCGLAQEAPTVLAFDDLHWADQASLDLLLSICTVVASYPLLLMCLLRPDREALAWSTIEAARTKLGDRFSEIVLEPLSGEHAQELLGNLLYIEDLPESVRTLILNKAEGNPFFVEEVIRALIDSRHIVRENSHWRATREIVNVSVPNTLAGVLNARIDRLPDEPKRVAQVAAVIGRLFAHRVLEMVFARAPAEERIRALEPPLDTLIEEQLLRVRAREPELEYIFKHALTQEAAYNSLLLKRRKEFHRRVGASLEEIYAGRRDEFAPELAHHFWQGEDWARAGEYAMRAGAGAMKVYAQQEALAHYQRAVEALERVPDAAPQAVCDSVLAWTRAAYKVKPPAEILDRLARAEELARELNDKRRLAQVLHWISNVHLMDGYVSRALPALIENYRLSEELGDERLSITPSYYMSQFMVDADPRSAVAKLEQVIELAQKHENKEIEANAIATRGLAYGRLGEFALAENELRRALEIAHSLNSPLVQADVNILAGYAYLDMGDASRALEYGERGAERALQAGALECAFHGKCVVGRANLQAQQSAEAQMAFEEALRLSNLANLGPLENQGRAGLAVAQFVAGRAEGIQDMENALSRAQSISDPFTASFLSQALGESYAELGELEAAERHLAAALAYYRRSDMRPYLSRGLGLLATVYEKQGRSAEADRLRAEAGDFEEECR